MGGQSTVLDAASPITSTTSGLINVTAAFCKIDNLRVTGNTSNGIYTSTQAMHCTITNCILQNQISSNTTSPVVGIFSASIHCRIFNNQCLNYSRGGSCTGISSSGTDVNIRGNYTWAQLISGSNVLTGINSSGARPIITSNYIGTEYHDTSNGVTVGLHVSSAQGAVISNNTIHPGRDGGTNTSNTFAMRLPATPNRYSVVSNFLMVGNGAAFTTNGTSEANTAPHTTAAQTPVGLGTGGVLAFNVR
jgi:hypothetical protein